jgi:hypothetical protein
MRATRLRGDRIDYTPSTWRPEERSRIGLHHRRADPERLRSRFGSRRRTARSASSTARFSVNGVAERFIHTLKENLLWVRHFVTVAELVEALREFRRRCNAEWLIERHGFRTPSQARLEIAAAG